LGIGPGASVATASPADGRSSSTPSGSVANDAPSDRAAGGGSWLTIDHDSSRSDGPGDRTASTPDTDTDTDTDPRTDPGTDAVTVDSPAVPDASGHGRRVVFDQSDQRVWLVDASDTVVRTYLVSGSKHDNLQPGTYEVYSRSLDAVSFDGRETMRYMVRFTQGKHAPIGFHDIPRRPDGSLVETRDQLGTPLSAGCVRQWEPDAKAMWRFAALGTSVVVVA
jgi:lipoprotein-anchoring transpeptidase ErfK/SrfK